MRPFVAIDKNTGAEVWIQGGAGTIERIDIKESQGTASIAIKNSNPKVRFPAIGWVRLDDPLYEVAQKLYQQKAEVSYTIESQRKAHVDNDIPIKELRVSVSVAAENCVNILGSLNDTKSLESTVDTSPITNLPSSPAPTSAVSNTEPVPSQYDNGPVTNSNNNTQVTGNVSQVNRNNSSNFQGSRDFSYERSVDDLLDDLNVAVNEGNNFIINALVSKLVSVGAPLGRVNAILNSKAASPHSSRDFKNHIQTQHSFAKEEARWKEFNSDNFVNVGSSVVQASVSAEGFARDELFRSGMFSQEQLNTPSEDDLKIISWVTQQILFISDLTQKYFYEIQDTTGALSFRPDRAIDSHTRARGLVYDTIRNSNPSPSERDGKAWEDWRELTLDIVKNRIRIILESAYPGIPLRSNSKTEQGADNVTQESGVNESASNEVHNAVDINNDNTVGETSSLANSEDTTVETTITHDNNNVEERPSFLYPRTVNKINTQNPEASEVTINVLKMVAEDSLQPDEFKYIGALLSDAFGVSAAKKITEKNLSGWIDFYVSDEEALSQAIEWAKNQEEGN